ncbi:RagB/SusD family nutrient uptake outer membrane protein [Marinoscillum furvescens]|uniref:Putative outer membrane starch-binding protein n=1 Tax=Marinoscillum furvescens DSM 4134 TaxID=1122208 RepID=A0A3D9L2Q1_MARFU|nr:RagB/SusD family nutrient uptake outer membrane protein [Marinoscillum furvescens]RED95972.1 putative outer membrane starch-binding protein [Marinoscillum furvescens DSM 4134]
MKLYNKLIAWSMVFVAMGCEDKFLDLDPLDQVTETVYFTEVEHFEAAATDLHSGMVSLRSNRGSSIFDFFDLGSDLTGYDPGDGIGNGSNTIPNDDKYWTNAYYYLRNANILLSKAEEFAGDQEAIEQYVATAHFFRAWQHFFLLQRFGGVPIVTTVLDLDSPELFASRNSRYEVVDQIIKDLDMAIASLPTEQSLGDENKGLIGQYSAKAFKAKVMLYEATWEKYVGTSTDGDGESSGAGSQKPEGYISVNEMLTEAIAQARDVMDNGGYELWNYNEELDSLSNWFLFNLEDAESNPAGLTKASNKEFIIQSIYDRNLRTGGTGTSHTVYDRLAPSRKLMDLALCADGLPVDKSPLFEGYNKTSDEFKNRDFRLISYFGELVPEDGSVFLSGAPGAASGAGVKARKFRSYNYGVYRLSGEESYNWPHLRLAEVYLIYAEALYERDGGISDADLDASLNQVRNRAGVAPLSNALAAANDLDILEEIRRERAIELYAENSRFNDLKRWGIAEQELNEDVLGPVIEGTEYESNGLYDPSAYAYGVKAVETGVGVREAVILNPSFNRNFSRKNYLFPIPLNQIKLNYNLTQNPEW